MALALIAGLLVVSSCRKKPKDDDHNHNNNGATTGNLTVEFEAVVDTNALVFNTKNYINANGDTFTVSVFKYYVSNFVLTKADNSTYTVPNSYYLVNHNSSNSFTITLPNVPVANYKSMTFLLGVDSAKNLINNNTGDLDPSYGMYWPWNQGYIMAKFEGASPQSGSSTKALLYHVGGFSGVNNTIKNINMNFGGLTADVDGSHVPNVHIKVDIAEWFKNPATINVATTHTIHMPGTMAKMMADNYADMFMLHHIHNGH